MLKKLLFLLFVCNLSFGQIKYPDAKQHLKEFLVMQSLLCENRIEDLKEFFSKNNYTFNGDDNNLIYQKLNLDIVGDSSGVSTISTLCRPTAFSNNEISSFSTNK